MRLDLDAADLNIIMQHLEMGQFKTVAPVLMKIQSQVIAQQAPKADVPEEPVSAGGTD